jgi:glutamate synthase domain-containing protein 1
LLGSGYKQQHPVEKVRFAGGLLTETTTAWLAGGLSITRDQLIERQTELGIAMLHNAFMMVPFAFRSRPPEALG